MPSRAEAAISLLVVEDSEDDAWLAVRRLERVDSAACVRAALARLGCDQAQGYLYSRPVPAQEIEARYARRAGA